MADNETVDMRRTLNPGRLAAAAMAVGGALLAAGALVWALAHFWELSQSDKPVLTEVVATAALLLVGWALALMLWGAAEMLRKVSDLLETLRSVSVMTPGTPLLPAGRPAAADAQVRLLEELIRLTREVRDISLLNEPGRAARLQAEEKALVEQLEKEVVALLREHNWPEARQRVDRARQRFPALPTWAALDKQIEEARARFEAHDLEVATREINELIHLGAWDRAADVVRHIHERHPASPNVAELARRVAVGRDKAAAEERARLMAQAQEATNRHDWVEALRIVERIVERFPTSSEAHDLRMQVSTLRTNAEVQTRQQMEARIRDLIKERRFRDGLREAQALIERYPESPQAAVLRGQLAKLEQRAAEAR